MWCIVGLGNPGPHYQRSRHNVGFQCIDRLCQVSEICLTHHTSLVAWGVGSWCNQEILLARPLTYMNRSGVGLRALMRVHRTCRADLIVVHDDLDLALGRLKFKQRGGDGGHKGLRSIVEAVGGDRFLRLRIGIGRPPKGVDAVEYVLAPFEEEERDIIEKALQRAVGAVKTLMREGLAEAMSLYHTPSGGETMAGEE